MSSVCAPESMATACELPMISSGRTVSESAANAAEAVEAEVEADFESAALAVAAGDFDLLGRVSASERLPVFA